MYRLSFKQKLYLIPLKLIWRIWPVQNKKSWHEVKKGMEKHQHICDIMFMRDGKKFLSCNHEGCSYFVEYKTTGSPK